MRLLHVYKQRDQLYAFTPEESVEQSGRLWRHKLQDDLAPLVTYDVIRMGRTGYESMRPYFSLGCYWLKSETVVHRVPLEELFLYHDVDQAKQEALRTKYPNIRARDWSFQYWPIKPLGERRIHNGGGMGFSGLGHLCDLRFDGFPLGDDHFRVFSPDEEGKKLDVWDVKGKWNHEAQTWKFDWDAEPREVIRPGFKAPFWWDEKAKKWKREPFDRKREFYAFNSRDAYLFVTDTYELFASPKSKGKERELVPVSMPKVAFTKMILFTDMDQDKRFLLGVDAKSGLVHFAEMTQHPRFRTVRFKDLKAVECVEPVKTAREALQILRDAKLISLNEKAK